MVKVVPYKPGDVSQKMNLAARRILEDITRGGGELISVKTYILLTVRMILTLRVSNHIDVHAWRLFTE